MTSTGFDLIIKPNANQFTAIVYNRRLKHKKYKNRQIQHQKTTNHQNPPQRQPHLVLTTKKPST